MFITHLTFFLSSIGLLLFVIRSYSQTASEKFLAFFSFLFFVMNGFELFLNYYTKELLPIYYSINSFAFILGNIALLTPVVIVYLFRKKTNNATLLFSFISTLLIGTLYSFLHFFITTDSQNHLVFFPDNTNFIYNLEIQIAYVLILLITFLYNLRKNNINTTIELFDGTYKKVFSLLFIAYYLQDITTHILWGLVYLKLELFSDITLIYLVLNFIMALLIMTLAIYTNWLSLFNNLKSKWSQEETEVVKNAVYVLDLKEAGIQINNWRDLKEFMSNDYPKLIEEIEQLDFLSKNEKMYATLLPFELKQKEIADLLSISLRTVETNFYRLRTKLKENNRSVNYPYNSL